MIFLWKYLEIVCLGSSMEYEKWSRRTMWFKGICCVVLMCLCRRGGIGSLWRQRKTEREFLAGSVWWFSGKEGEMSKIKFMKLAKGLVVNSQWYHFKETSCKETNYFSMHMELECFIWVCWYLRQTTPKYASMAYWLVLIKIT